MNKWLILHTGGLGDFLMFSPVLKILLENEYLCEIVSLDEGSFRFINQFYRKKFDDRIKVYHYPGIVKPFEVTKFLIKNLFKKYYGICSTMPFNSIKGVIFLKMLNAKIKIIRLAKKIKYVEKLLSKNDFLLIADFNKHLVFENMEILKYIDLYKEPTSYFFPAFEQFSKNPSKHVLISPGSSKGGIYKRYPIQLWEKVIDLLCEKGLKVSVLLGPTERDLESIFLRYRYKYANNLEVYISTDYEQSLNLIANHKILLHNDNGVGHLAAALNLEYLTIISIFGPANPSRTAPFFKNRFIIKPEIIIDCIPCIRPGGRYGCNEQKCLNSIPPETIVNAVLKFLK